MPAVNQIPDKLERAAVASDLAGYLGVEPGLVLDQLKRAAAERRVPAAQPARPSAVPAIERMLLSALISSEQARAEMLPQIPESVTSDFATREIFAALRNILASRDTTAGPIAFSALEGRLSPPARDLLHHIVAADEIVDESQAFEQARACLRRLDLDLQKRRIGDLRAKVKSAEREGRIEEALRWMAELERM